MESKKEYLKPMFESVKSYYNKAYIIDKSKYKNKDDVWKLGSKKNIDITLYSYDTKILKITNKNKEFNYIKFYYKNINNKKIYSQTTLRHIKEFLKQYYYNLYIYKDLLNIKGYTKQTIKDLIKNDNYLIKENKDIKEV